MFGEPTTGDLVTSNEINSLIAASSQPLQKVGRWILNKDFVIHLCFSGFVDAHLEIDVPAGFLFEHSVPRGFQWFLEPTYGNKAAAFLHDALYRSGLVNKVVADAAYEWLTTSTEQSRGFVTRWAAGAVKAFGRPPILPTTLVGAALHQPSNIHSRLRQPITHITLFFQTEHSHDA